MAILGLYDSIELQYVKLLQNGSFFISDFSGRLMNYDSKYNFRMNRSRWLVLGSPFGLLGKNFRIISIGYL